MRFFVGLMAIASLTAAAQGSPRPQYRSAAPIAYMIDASSGAVLFDKNAHRKIAPASMAKMMTAYVAFELIADGKLNPEQSYSVRPETWKTWNSVGSTMDLKPNEKVRVSDLLHGVVTLSANDAAIVLAEGIAGNESAFAARMNGTAKRLGMRDSHFSSANGWPDEGRTMTTAHDLALLGARTITDFPLLYRQYYGQSSFRWRNIMQPNRNPVMGLIDGADGMKTGQTAQAGYCFTGTAKQNGRRIIMVVAGLTSAPERTSESGRFLQWGFDAWRAHPLYASGQVVTRLPVQLGDSTGVFVVAPRSLSLTVPKFSKLRYRLKVRYNGPLKAPIWQGNEVAQLVATFEDGSTQIMPLVAGESVSAVGFFGRAWNGLKSLVGA